MGSRAGYRVLKQLAVSQLWVPEEERHMGLVGPMISVPFQTSNSLVVVRSNY